MISRVIIENSRAEFHLDLRVLQFLYSVVGNMKTGIFIAPKSQTLELLDLGGRHDPG